MLESADSVAPAALPSAPASPRALCDGSLAAGLEIPAQDWSALGVRIRMRPAAARRAVIVEVAGEIDAPEAAALQSTLRALLNQTAAVVLDLSAVRFFGSPGLALLMAAENTATGCGARFLVATGAANRVVRRPLAITGLDAELAIHPTAVAAVETLHNASPR